MELIHAYFPSREDLSRAKGRDMDENEYYVRLSTFMLREYSKALDRELLKIDNDILENWGN